MTLTLITGPLGSGKTALLSWILQNRYREGKEIWTNYHFDYSSRVSPFEALLFDDPTNVVLGGDEFWTALDARKSMSGTNESLNDIMLASRKHDVEIIGTAQLARMVDVRYRAISDYVILCNNVSGPNAGLDTIIDTYVGYWDMESPRLRGIDDDLSIEISELINPDTGKVCYNTNEIIEGNKWLWLEEMSKVLLKNGEFMKRWDLRKTETAKKDLLRFAVGRSGSWVNELYYEFQSVMEKEGVCV